MYFWTKNDKSLWERFWGCFGDDISMFFLFFCFFGHMLQKVILEYFDVSLFLITKFMVRSAYELPKASSVYGV